MQKQISSQKKRQSLPRVIRPINITWKTLTFLLFLIIIAEFSGAFLEAKLVFPYLHDKLGNHTPVHDRGEPTVALEVLSTVIFAPAMEEMIFRLPFAFGFVNLVKMASKIKLRGNDTLTTDALATVLILILFSLAAIACLSGGASIILLYAELFSFLITAYITYTVWTKDTISSRTILILGIISTILFSLAHLNRYDYYPNSLIVALLTIPQLLGGFVYFYAARRHNLLVAMLCHALSNGLLFFISFNKIFANA